MENTQNTGAVITNQTYTPPKMWKDLTDSEKIERMREIIKQMQYQISTCQGNTQDLKNDFQNHAHIDGKIMKDVKAFNNCGMGLLGAKSALSREDETLGSVFF